MPGGNKQAKNTWYKNPPLIPNFMWTEIEASTTFLHNQAA